LKTQYARASAFAALFLPLFIGACAGAPSQPAGPVGPNVSQYRGVPGFDTRVYPGDAAMTTWRSTSPYRWVGYYLPAPCYTGTSWVGRRAALQRLQWGLAVLFVGEQDWAAMRAAPGDTVTAAAENPRCTRTNLNAATAAANAAAADSVAAAEGFPAGTVIFLDVERVETVSPQLSEYVRSWSDALLELGHYLPGLYAHERNAAELYALQMAAFQRHQIRGTPCLWVASPTGFALEKAPGESGFPDAAIWQGVFNRRETWGGVSLTIDVNVADGEDPSNSVAANGLRGAPERAAPRYGLTQPHPFNSVER
jgi:hypothetical protein